MDLKKIKTRAALSLLMLTVLAGVSFAQTPTATISEEATYLSATRSGFPGTTTYYVYDWRLNGTSIAYFNYTFTDSTNIGRDFTNRGGDATAVGGDIAYNSASEVTDAGIARITVGGSYLDLPDNYDLSEIANSTLFAKAKYTTGTGGEGCIVGVDETDVGGSEHRWHIACIGDGPTCDLYSFVSNGTNYINISDTDTDIARDTWFRTALTFDGSLALKDRGKVYVDGTTEAPNSSNAGYGDTTTTSEIRFRIGNCDRPSGGDFVGDFETVMVHDRTLSIGQLGYLMADEYNKLHNDELIQGSWTVQVTGFNDSGLQTGQVLSNTITISPKATITEETNNLLATPSYFDLSTTHYAYDWRVNGTSIAHANVYFGSATPIDLTTNTITITPTGGGSPAFKSTSTLGVPGVPVYETTVNAGSGGAYTIGYDGLDGTSATGDMTILAWTRQTTGDTPPARFYYGTGIQSRPSTGPGFDIYDGDDWGLLFGGGANQPPRGSADQLWIAYGYHVTPSGSSAWVDGVEYGNNARGSTNIGAGQRIFGYGAQEAYWFQAYEGVPSDAQMLLLGTDHTNNKLHNDELTTGSWTVQVTGFDASGNQTGQVISNTISPDPGGVETDLALWLKADAGTNTTTEGASVTSWVSQVNALDDFVQATPAKQPTYKNNYVNFNPAVYFATGVQDYLEEAALAAPFPLSQPFTCIAVGVNEDPSFAWQFIFDSSSVTDRVFWVINGAGTMGIGAVSPTANSTTSAPLNEPHIFFAEYNGASSKVSFDNEALETLGTNPGTNSLTDLDIGVRYDGTQPSLNRAWEGPIPELIVYDGILTPGEISRITSYLAIKYGITLDQSPAQNYLDSAETVIWNGTTNATYNNDIAGISRDTTSELLQLKSKSENSDGVVAIGADAIGTDKNFLVWGNDNGSVDTAETTDKPGSITKRLAREWKFQETGELGSVTVGFDLDKQSALTNHAPDASKYSLLVDDDGTFSDATVVTSGRTFNGNEIEFTYNLDDASEAYFTLGYSGATLRRRVIVVESN